MHPDCLLPLLLVTLLALAADAEIDLSRPDEPWRQAATGIVGTVPPPFEPVAMEGGEVRVWGRRYTMACPLPSAIESQGLSLLAGPIRVVVRAGGREEVIGAQPVETTAAGPRRAVFRGGAGGLVPLGVEGWIEYDGALRAELALAPAAPVKLDYVGVEVPVSREVARFYHAHSTWSKYLYGTVGEQVVVGEARTRDELAGVDDAAAAKRPGDGPPAGTTAVTAEGVDWGFETSWEALWWLGDHERGLTVVTETPRGWTGPRGQAIRLARRADSVVLSLNWINEPTEIAEPRSLTIGLQATPGKPLPPTWHGRQVGPLAIPAGEAEAAALVDEQGINIGFVWNNHTVAFSYPQMKDPEAVRAAVRAYHQQGVRCVVYVTLSGTGNGTPVFLRNRDEWLMTNGGKVLFESAGGADGGYSSCCPVSSYSDWLVWSIDQAMEAYDLDGVYIDNAGPYYCDNPRHGHAGRDYPYFANRALQERIWQVVRRHKPETGIVWEHNSRTSNSLNLTFVDIYSDGEHFRVKSKGMTEEITPTLLAITGTGRQWGAQPCFLPSALNAREEYTRWLLARLLPLGNAMMMHSSWLDFSSYAPALAARREFGLAEQPVTWFTPERLPEWLVLTGTRTAPDGTLRVPVPLVAGGYQRPDGALLLTIGNWNPHHAAARLDLRPLAKLLGAQPVAIDAESKAPCRPIGPSLVLTIPANDYRMIRIERP